MRWQTPETSILDHLKIVNFFEKRPWLIKLACYLGIAFFALDFLPAVSTYFWPSTIGTVISSSVGTYYCTGLYTSKCYVPIIEYRYKVHGKEHISNRYSFQGNLSGWGFDSIVLRPPSQEVIGNYEPNQNIIVVYNPFDPTNTVLQRGYFFESLRCSVLFLSILTLYALKFWPEKFKSKQNSLDEFPEI